MAELLVVPRGLAVLGLMLLAEVGAAGLLALQGVADDQLAELGELTVHARTPPDQVVERARGAQIALTNKSLLPADTIAALSDLEFISVLATGTNVVDLEAAMQAGIDTARGVNIVTMDADLQNDPRDIPAMLDEIEAGRQPAGAR